MLRFKSSSRHLALVLLVTLLMVGGTQARPSGISGDVAVDDTDVAKTGCTCHSGDQITPDDSVTLLVSGLPYLYEGDVAYELKIQIIGGPDIGGDHSGGFSMRTSAGNLAGAAGYEDMVQNGDDASSLTHTADGSNTADRSWMIIWTAPAADSGDISFWLAGNSVDGDGSQLGDAWNRLSFSLSEGQDNGQTRTVFAGNGDVSAPEGEAGHLDLHDMGAPFRAHWLGLLGFGAVVAVILFCGFFLRYGFSRHYEGRSNLVRLRMKHLRRGDQL